MKLGSCRLDVEAFRSGRVDVCPGEGPRWGGRLDVRALLLVIPMEGNKIAKTVRVWAPLPVPETRPQRPHVH